MFVNVYKSIKLISINGRFFLLGPKNGLHSTLTAYQNQLLIGKCQRHLFKIFKLFLLELPKYCITFGFLDVNPVYSSGEHGCFEFPAIRSLDPGMRFGWK